MASIRWCRDFSPSHSRLRWFLVSGVLAALAGIYALYYTDFNPVVIGLFALGAIVLLAYTYPFKYWGLGEFAIFLIWGPIMIGGVYFVLSGWSGNLECCAGGHSLWFGCCQHQHR